MKTAIKYPLVVLIALGAIASVSARAQTSVAPGPGSVALPSGLSAQPTSPIPTAPAPVAAAPSNPLPASLSASSSKDSSAIPGSVQNVLDKMKDNSQDVTLGDLNTAREAIAKLDMMIDIEKRLSDLATIRKEREEKSMTAVAAALPPAAYTPPPALPAPAASAPILGGAASDYGLPDPTKMGSILGGTSIGGGTKHATSEAGPNKVDIQRIIGAEGRYIAYIKGDDGRESPYHQGDKLSDGSQITSISRNGVTLSKNKKTSTYQVKDIAKVFGAR